MIPLDLKWIRAQFPALTQEINGKPVIFLDGPGGTQIPGSVIDAINSYLVRSNANAHGAFVTSRQTDEIIAAARSASADLLGCSADEIVFGGNMTSLTFAVSRALSREWQPGDEIIVTKLDHYGNVSPWKALEEKGLVIRTVEMEVEECKLNLSDLQSLLNERTRLVAVGYACNAVGTINDVAKIVRLAHAVGALVFVDAVHYAPHGLIDVRSLDCDFLICSAYKFFGPHVGILYGKKEHLAHFRPYKVKPAPEQVPFCWETGTQNHEALAGLVAAINYLAELGCHITSSVKGEWSSVNVEMKNNKEKPFRCPQHFASVAQELDLSAHSYPSRRGAIIAAMIAISQYERKLCEHLIWELLQIPRIKIYGITNISEFAWRTPTVAITVSGITPELLAQELGDRGIFTWHGNFYALGVTETLGVESSGGLLRIGLVHYNTVDEIDRFAESLKAIVELISDQASVLS